MQKPFPQSIRALTQKIGEIMNKVLIIAEAGVNHNGDMEIAKKLIDVAKESGADIVKFQTGMPHKVTSKYAKQAEYQTVNTKIEESQLDMLKKLHFPTYEAFEEISDYCKEVGIEFLSTPFEVESVQYLSGLDMNYWKIPSGEITNLPYLLEIAKTPKPVILSTGMSTMEEVETAVAFLKEHGLNDISLLQCTTEYPAPYEDVNLRVIPEMAKKFGVKVGLSDHTPGIAVSTAAVAMGASIIEKHFTLDKELPGPDHKASLEPQELKDLVTAIRQVEMAMGNGIKEVSASERKNIAIARKSIIAKRDIKKGEILSEDNLTTKRPGNGVSPMKWFDVIGTEAIRDFKEDELIEINND